MEREEAEDSSKEEDNNNEDDEKEVPEESTCSWFRWRHICGEVAKDYQAKKEDTREEVLFSRDQCTVQVSWSGSFFQRYPLPVVQSPWAEAGKTENETWLSYRQTQPLRCMEHVVFSTQTDTSYKPTISPAHLEKFVISNLLLKWLEFEHPTDKCAPGLIPALIHCLREFFTTMRHLSHQHAWHHSCVVTKTLPILLGSTFISGSFWQGLPGDKD